MVKEKLRERHHTDHPFATNKRFRTDGKFIIMETVTSDEKRHLNLMNDNFEMGLVIEPSLFENVLYADDLASRWRPDREFQRVVLDPKFAFGRPVIDGIWIPTDALYSAFQAEKSIGLVSEDFEVDEDAVRQAVGFEERLRAGAGFEDQVG